MIMAARLPIRTLLRDATMMLVGCIIGLVLAKVFISSDLNRLHVAALELCGTAVIHVSKRSAKGVGGLYVINDDVTDDYVISSASTSGSSDGNYRDVIVGATGRDGKWGEHDSESLRQNLGLYPYQGYAGSGDIERQQFYKRQKKIDRDFVGSINGGSMLEDRGSGSNQLEGIASRDRYEVKESLTDSESSSTHPNINADSSPSSHSQLKLNEQSIFVGVLTTDDHVSSAAKAIDGTWAQGVPKVVYFSSTNSTTVNNERGDVQLTHSEVVRMSLPSKLNDTTTANPQAVLPVLISRLYRALIYVYDNHLENFDWLFLASDATYVRTEHLTRYLSNLDPNDKLYIGCPVSIKRTTLAGKESGRLKEQTTHGRAMDDISRKGSQYTSKVSRSRSNNRHGNNSKEDSKQSNSHDTENNSRTDTPHSSKEAIDHTTMSDDIDPESSRNKLPHDSKETNNLSDNIDSESSRTKPPHNSKETNNLSDNIDSESSRTKPPHNSKETNNLSDNIDPESSRSIGSSRDIAHRFSHCDGGAGVVYSRGLLASLIPRLKQCLLRIAIATGSSGGGRYNRKRNGGVEDVSYCEDGDVLVGRCIWGELGVECSQGDENHLFMDSLSTDVELLPPSPTLLKAVTLHSNAFREDPFRMFKVHQLYEELDRKYIYIHNEDAS